MTNRVLDNTKCTPKTSPPLLPRKSTKSTTVKKEEASNCNITHRPIIIHSQSESHANMWSATKDDSKLASTVKINTLSDGLKKLSVSFDDILSPILDNVNGKTKYQRLNSGSDLESEEIDKNGKEITQSKLYYGPEKCDSVQLEKTGKEPMALPPPCPVDVNFDNLLITDKYKINVKSNLENEPKTDNNEITQSKMQYNSEKCDRVKLEKTIPSPFPKLKSRLNIKSLETERFFRNTDRKGAKKILADLGDGSFLFRPSKQFFLSLSINHGGECFNLGIDKTRDNKLCLDTPYVSPEFESLTEIVEHFTKKGITFKYKNQEIKTTLVKTLPPIKF